MRAVFSLCLAVLAVAILTAAFPTTASAFQFNATVRGKVTDVDGNPIEGVRVTIRKLVQDPSRPFETIELTTDEDGNYYARNVPTGEALLNFEFEGLEPVEEQRELRVGPVRIDITMTAVEIPEQFVQAQVANEAYGAGADAFNAGNFEEAVTQMGLALEALADTPENAEARSHVFTLLGAAYMRQRKFDEAIEAFTTRLGYMPDDAAAHLDLAQALGESGDEAAARPHYEAALALDPDDAATQYNVGVTMVNAGDVEGGIVHIERAIELQPVYPLAYKNIGYAYARIEAYREAVAAFEKYLEQEPESADAAQIRDFIAALKEMIG
jgi:tetratricopeptide (TPR) repeat protein